MDIKVEKIEPNLCSMELAIIFTNEFFWFWYPGPRTVACTVDKKNWMDGFLSFQPRAMAWVEAWTAGPEPAYSQEG